MLCLLRSVCVTRSPTYSLSESQLNCFFGTNKSYVGYKAHSIQIMQCADQADQVQRLLAFLEPVTSLQTPADRIKTYQETWAKLDPYAQGIVWQPDMSVNYPWDGKEHLWKTLRVEMETKFRAVICAECSNEVTMRPIQPFCFIDYSQMLIELLDTFLEGLDDYIAIQDDISKVSANMHAYPEDTRCFVQKRLYTAGFNRAKEFLDVILFMHAVPQRADRWDALDHESDVTWFREHCRVYQENQDLMAFLRDCAVVVLMTGYFVVPQDVQSIHDCYTLHAGQGNTPTPCQIK